MRARAQTTAKGQHARTACPAGCDTRARGRSSGSAVPGGAGSARALMASARSVGKRTQMRLPTHLSTSSLGSRCDTLPPCCLVGSAILAQGAGSAVAERRRGAPGALAPLPLPLLSRCNAVPGSMRAAVGLRAACCSPLRRQHTRPAVSVAQRAPPPPLPRRLAAPAASPPRLSRRRAPPPPLRARGSGGGEPPPSDGDLTPLLVTYGGGAPLRALRSQPSHATLAESLALLRACAGVLGTAVVAGIAYFGADAWLNNDDIFYGTSAGLSPGCVRCKRAWLA